MPATSWGRARWPSLTPVAAPHARPILSVQARDCSVMLRYQGLTSGPPYKRQPRPLDCSHRAVGFLYPGGLQPTACHGLDVLKTQTFRISPWQAAAHLNAAALGLVDNKPLDWMDRASPHVPAPRGQPAIFQASPIQSRSCRPRHNPLGSGARRVPERLLQLHNSPNLDTRALASSVLHNHRVSSARVL